MGGYGSGRHNPNKKRLVEDGYKLSIKTFLPSLAPTAAGNKLSGSVWWSSGDRKLAEIGYRVTEGPALLLIYSVNWAAQAYPVNLTTTPTPWGAVRWWFACPECGRRCGCLHLPPGSLRFACRQCHNLAYHSNQAQHKFDGVYKRLAGMMGGDMTPSMAKEALDYAFKDGAEPAPFLWPKPRDTHPARLTAAELCEQSGLTADDLAGLESVRLLLPDRPSGLYRPKLVGWGRKLAYLLRAGWPLESVQAWARGRWRTSNPRQWPPNLEDWTAPDV